MIRRFVLATACALGLVQATAALAQSWPDKPVKLVVPFPPGGPIDTMGRLVAHNLSQSLGQQVVVENRPGAGSTIGTKSVAIADPDGYTLLFGSSGSLAVAPALYSNFDVDPRKAFVTVATVALLPHVLVVAPAVPARTVAEFIAYAKANPGKLNYGAGLGTPPHLLSTLFKVKAGLDLVYVPYKGSAASITDLLGGQTHMTIDGLTGLYPLIRDGKVRPLAVARPARWAELPDVPTLAESGFPDFVIDAWTGRRRACRHAAAGDREAQRRHQRGPAGRRDQGQPGEVQRHRQGRHAAGFRRVPRPRDGEMGGDRAARRRED